MKLTVTGLKTGTTDINASERGVYKGWVFQVDVKPRKEIGVRVFSATDAERGPGSLLRFMPTQATLQAVSDKILPQQANVTFKVEDGGSFSADFDLDGDGRLL